MSKIIASLFVYLFLSSTLFAQAVSNLPRECDSINDFSNQTSFNSNPRIVLNYAIQGVALTYQEKLEHIINRGDSRLSKVMSYISIATKPKSIEMIEDENFVKLLKLRQRLLKQRNNLLDTVHNMYSVTPDNISTDLSEAIENDIFNSCTICVHYSCANDPDLLNCVDYSNEVVKTKAHKNLKSFIRLLRTSLGFAIKLNKQENKEVNFRNLISDWKKSFKKDLRDSPSDL
jgi:hypothetical protein